MHLHMYAFSYVSFFFRILDNSQTELLKHPIVESFIQMKYLMIGKTYNFADLVFYMIFLSRWCLFSASPMITYFFSMTLLILTNHSVWLPPLLENSKSTFKTITLILSIICLVTYILLEIGKLLFLFEFWLKKKDVLWLAVLNLSTIYISQESLPK